MIVFWQGLFDEEMVLGRLRFGDASIWHEMSVLTENRASYEGRIKKKAFEDVSVSSVMMGGEELK